MQPQPFIPREANANPPTAQGSVAVTTAVAQLSIPGAPFETAATARFVVDGSQEIFWCFGAQAGLTASNGVPMLGNTVEVFSIPPGVTQISTIATVAGSTLRVTVGDGF